MFLLLYKLIHHSIQNGIWNRFDICCAGQCHQTYCCMRSHHIRVGVTFSQGFLARGSWGCWRWSGLLTSVSSSNSLWYTLCFVIYFFLCFIFVSLLNFSDSDSVRLYVRIHFQSINAVCVENVCFYSRNHWLQIIIFSMRCFRLMEEIYSTAKKNNEFREMKKIETNLPHLGLNESQSPHNLFPILPHTPILLPNYSIISLRKSIQSYSYHRWSSQYFCPFRSFLFVVSVQ